MLVMQEGKRENFEWAVDAIRKLAGVDRITAVRLLVSEDGQFREDPKLVMDMCRSAGKMAGEVLGP